MLSASNSTPLSKQYSLQSKWNLLFDTKSPEWMSCKPQLGLKVYACYVCKHMFSSRLTFQDHVNRRVFLIKYKCSDCSTHFTFYNRCSFLLHTRKHYNGTKEAVLNLANVDISILPVDLAGFVRHEGLPFLYDDEECLVNQGEGVSSQLYTPDESECGKEVVTLKPFNLVFPTADQNQYMTLKQISSNIPLCEFVPQNELTYSTTPKEVKKEPSPDSNTCTECLKTPKHGLGAHFLAKNKPLDANLCCPVCKYLSPSKCSYSAHVRAHKNHPPHVCPECGCTCATATALHEHMQDICYHMHKQVRFRCPGNKCGKLFVMANTYATHLYNHLQCVKRCNVCMAAFTHESDFVQHKLVHDCQGIKSYNCVLCKADSAEATFGEEKCSQHVNAHMRDRDNTVYVFSCKLCRSAFRSSATFSVHKKRCSNRTDVATLCANCKQVVTFNGEQTAKACPHCKHLNRCPKSAGQDPKKIICVLCKEEVSAEEKVAHAKLCKYNNPVVILSDEDEEEKAAEPARKRTKTGGVAAYACKICRVETCDREIFHRHIVGHRDVETAYQCMECGECFVVRPSLVKHLLHYHQIEADERYFEENQCCDKKKGAAKNRVRPNQCSVCLEQFGDATELKKHFRVHGMAFLLQKFK